MDDDGRPMTVADFRHSGWDDHSPYFGICNYAWGVTLDMSRQWCQSGE